MSFSVISTPSSLPTSLTILLVCSSHGLAATGIPRISTHFLRVYCSRSWLALVTDSSDLSMLSIVAFRILFSSCKILLSSCKAFLSSFEVFIICSNSSYSHSQIRHDSSPHQLIFFNSAILELSGLSLSSKILANWSQLIAVILVDTRNIRQIGQITRYRSLKYDSLQFLQERRKKQIIGYHI